MKFGLLCRRFINRNEEPHTICVRVYHIKWNAAL